ncbi:hypothetical protein FEM41_14910 [Jejubacter calystegiae]|uniref:Cyanophage baseplate Pam3 plug gp18 domain-containing protein n=1 Tax=Jejubacter calystegiae TaxID=2579935 RepID=A0A4P8YMD2_9ENTR|nr:hypothetical protein [Jejubacter calystegiae]QCT20844.1 hypothetical protein FEM41_14910 [Jejubacter calystegiae]
MSITEIPLTANNQTFSISLAGTDYRITVLWRGTFWCLDLVDAVGNTIIAGIPLVTGYDLLKQYEYLKLGFALYVVCDVAGQENPTSYDLGTLSHLLVVTE